jgi:type II secretory pathway component PulJ
VRSHRSEEGFTLIQAVISISLTMMFVSLAYFQAQTVNRFERRSTLLTRALGVAINTMENLKFQEKLTVGEFETREGEFFIFTRVEEFSPSLHKLRVVVKDRDEQEILSLQTLRKK